LPEKSKELANLARIGKLTAEPGTEGGNAKDVQVTDYH